MLVFVADTTALDEEELPIFLKKSFSSLKSGGGTLSLVKGYFESLSGSMMKLPFSKNSTTNTSSGWISASSIISSLGWSNWGLSSLRRAEGYTDPVTSMLGSILHTRATPVLEGPIVDLNNAQRSRTVALMEIVT